jgi:PsbP
MKSPSSAPLTAATTRTPRPGGLDKEPWWANAYQPERPSNQPFPATKPDGRYPLAPTLQQSPVRQAPSHAGGPGTSGAGPQSPDLTARYSSAEAGAPHSSAGAGAHGPRAASGAGRGLSRKTLLLALVLVIIVAAGAVIAAVLSEHGRTTNAAQTTPARVTGIVPSVTSSSPALIVAINDATSAAPGNFATQAFTAAQTGTADGFSIGYPGNWQVKQHSGSPQRVFFDDPDGVSNVEVDLTAHTKSSMVAEAQYLQSQTLAQGTFPGYKQIRISAEDVRGTPGAIWEFDYTTSAGTVTRVEDILFVLQTKNGPQSYAILATSPTSVWQSTMLPRVEDMLKTFQPNP